jgi:flagellar basal body rod protein FlgG
MSDIYNITGVGLGAARRELDAVAGNVASARVPGYRRHVGASGAVVASAFADRLAPSASPVGDAVKSLPSSPTSRVDARPGAPIATGRALDVAIDAADLYFGLREGSAVWLTRAGALRVDDQGVLVGERGLPVVGAGGDIAVGAGDDIAITGDGRVLQRGALVGALQLFRSADGVVAPGGTGTLLESRGSPELVDPAQTRVRSGELESANVDAAAEAMELVALSRRYESLIRVTQSYDDMLGRAIQKLGES